MRYSLLTSGHRIPEGSVAWQPRALNFELVKRLGASVQSFDRNTAHGNKSKTKGCKEHNEEGARIVNVLRFYSRYNLKVSDTGNKKIIQLIKAKWLI